jgi:hypothetical protein
VRPTQRSGPAGLQAVRRIRFRLGAATRCRQSGDDPLVPAGPLLSSRSGPRTGAGLDRFRCCHSIAPPSDVLQAAWASEPDLGPSGGRVAPERLASRQDAIPNRSFPNCRGTPRREPSDRLAARTASVPRNPKPELDSAAPETEIGACLARVHLRKGNHHQRPLRPDPALPTRLGALSTRLGRPDPALLEMVSRFRWRRVDGTPGFSGARRRGGAPLFEGG